MASVNTVRGETKQKPLHVEGISFWVQWFHFSTFKLFYLLNGTGGRERATMDECMPEHSDFLTPYESLAS